MQKTVELAAGKLHAGGVDPTVPATTKAAAHISHLHAKLLLLLMVMTTTTIKVAMLMTTMMMTTTTMTMMIMMVIVMITMMMMTMIIILVTMILMIMTTIMIMVVMIMVAVLVFVLVSECWDSPSDITNPKEIVSSIWETQFATIMMTIETQQKREELSRFTAPSG